MSPDGMLSAHAERDKARHTAHISELEKAQAREKLVQALSDLDATDQWMGHISTAQDKIAEAMKILGMELTEFGRANYWKSLEQR